MDFSLGIFFTAFIAGITTVFAPCIFLFLPVVLGASNTEGQKNLRKTIVIIISLALSVFIFTLLLKASTALINIHPSAWEVLAGLIILFQGILIIFPEIWEKILTKVKLDRLGNNILNQGNKKGGILGDILIGFALGPIFSSCSPTYGFIVGAVFPANPVVSIIYLSVYLIGLSLMLGLVAYGGQTLVQKLKWGINPNGVFKRAIGILFILLGWSIIFGIHREVETFIVQELEIFDITRIEGGLLKEQL